jgi:hypothetical protein
MNVPQFLPALHIIKVDYTPKFFDVLAFADAVESRMEVSGIGRASLRVLGWWKYAAFQHITPWRLSTQ